MNEICSVSWTECIWLIQKDLIEGLIHVIHIIGEVIASEVSVTLDPSVSSVQIKLISIASKEVFKVQVGSLQVLILSVDE